MQKVWIACLYGLLFFPTEYQPLKITANSLQFADLSEREQSRSLSCCANLDSDALTDEDRLHYSNLQFRHPRTEFLSNSWQCNPVKIHWQFGIRCEE